MKHQLTHNGSYHQLAQKLAIASQKLPEYGGAFVKESAQQFHRTYLDHLEHQGRPGGHPPPLSDATKHLYSQLGEPDGSGIRDHISVTYRSEPNRAIAIVGIKAGNPTIVAKVQDRGATIPVTDAMRGFLAAHGIYLRAETTHITIPPRRSWEESIRKANDFSRRRLKLFWEQLF